jgi:hypothetical protein
MTLNRIERFDADISYGFGNFYRDIPEPVLAYDIDPQCDDVIEACSTDLPLPTSSMQSVVFDPPFLTYIRNARSHKSLMGKRFGGYWAYGELEDHYQKTLNEAHRVLKPEGVLVFKCQDIIHNHKMHPTHVNIINWAEGMFRLKDLFILAAKSRMDVPEQKNAQKRQQRHSRVYHSYFLVLERLKQSHEKY